MLTRGIENTLKVVDLGNLHVCTRFHSYMYVHMGMQTHTEEIKNVCMHVYAGI